MVSIEAAVAQINSIVWGVPLLVLILGTGVWLTIRLHAMPWRSIGEAFALLWRGRGEEGQGEISPFRALMTSLSATSIFWAGGLVSIWHGFDFIMHPPAAPPEYGWITWGTLGMSFCLDGAVLVGVLRELKRQGIPCFDMSTNLPEGEWPWGSPSFKALGPHKIELIYKSISWVNAGRSAMRVHEFV